ncbi:MAG: InlB B-repeat-containing protein, partial [Clostridia bacterium]
NITYVLAGDSPFSTANLPKKYTYGVGIEMLFAPEIDHILNGLYSFVGWCTNAGMTGDKKTSITATDSGDIALFGYSTKNEFTITYNMNGGEVMPDVDINLFNTFVGVDGKGMLLPALRQGYGLAGWYESADFAGEPILQIGKNTAHNVTLYAKWIGNEYNITYVLAGDSPFSTANLPKKYTYGVGIEMLFAPEIDHILNGLYSFVGWCTNAGMTGDKKTSITATDSGDIALFGYSTKNEFTITYNMNGGEVMPDVDINLFNTFVGVDGKGMLLPALRQGYGLAGWYESADFAGEPILQIGKNTAHNVTLYAKWI